MPRTASRSATSSGCALLAGGDAPTADGNGQADKAPATLFIEEMGKTGRARLINLAAPRVLAPALARRCQSSWWSDGRPADRSGRRDEIGQVEPRIAGRLRQADDGGNRYEAAHHHPPRGRR